MRLVRNIIETDRLSLVPMDAEFLAASVAGDRRLAERLIDASLPAEWPDEHPWLELRHRQTLQHPDWAPWLTRLSVLRSTRQVVGVIGFHGPPGGEWLADFAPDGVEFGYTTYAPWRRQGFAYEASAALIESAVRDDDVSTFVLSIAPTNLRSVALARKLGFRLAGQWTHAERGVENVFRLRRPNQG